LKGRFRRGLPLPSTLQCIPTAIEARTKGLRTAYLRFGLLDLFQELVPNGKELLTIWERSKGSLELLQLR
jgi:hypothetical protein